MQQSNGSKRICVKETKWYNRLFVKDAHGDVLSIYTSTSNKAADYTYDAWGEIQTKNESSSFENNPLRYYGQYYDYESGMTYLRARYYDSSIRQIL